MHSYEIKPSENLQEGDVVFMNQSGQAQKYDPSIGSGYLLGVMQNNRAVFTCTPASRNHNWLRDPEPLTPTQELCDAACILSGIEPPNRKVTPELTFPEYETIYDKFVRGRF